jgi:hypothetical protein
MVPHLSKSLILLTLLVVLLAPAGCSRDKEEAAGEKPPAAGTEETLAQKPPFAPVILDSIKGRVLEVVDADSFIFIRLAREGKEIWATVPTVEVKVGEDVTLLSANIFKQFHSTTLDRSFDELIFSTGIAGKVPSKRTPPAAREAAAAKAPIAAPTN